MTRVEVVYALSLFAAVCSALQVLSVEAGLRRTSGSGTFAAALVSIVVSVVLFWSLLLGRGVPQSVAPATLLPFVVAGLLNPAAFRLLYFEGIDRVGARLAATINAAYPAIASLMAVAALGETLTWIAGLGIACIVGGGGLLQLVRGAAREGEAGAADLIARELADVSPGDVLYPVVAVVLLATSYVLVKYGLDRMPDAVVATTVAQTTALVAVLGLLAGSRSLRGQLGTVPRPAYAAFAAGGVFIAAFWLAQFFALSIGTVVTVVPLVSTAPLFVVAISYAVARELPRSARVLLAVVAVVVGVGLVQLG